MSVIPVAIQTEDKEVVQLPPECRNLKFYGHTSLKGIYLVESEA
jgi:hypothetical protein